MMGFIITYRIGKGQKEFKKEFSKVEEKQKAMSQFFSTAPTNAELISVQPSEKKASIRRPMKIHNSFDQFISDQLQAIDKNNSDLIKVLKLDRKAWLARRKEPDVLYAKEIIEIAKFFELSSFEVLKAIEKAIL